MQLKHPCTPITAAGILFVLLSSASCAHYTVGVRPTDTPSQSSSFLYGRFDMDAPSELLALKGYPTMGFVIRCADGETYTIQFLKEKRVQVIEVAPAHCALVEVVFTDADGGIKGRKAAFGEPRSGVDLVAGTAYYLGDYVGKAHTDSDWRFFYTKYHSSWALTATDDNYDRTTAEMKRTFKNLASLPTANKMLVPPKIISGSRPTRQAVPPNGPDDVLTLERIARIAPLTKRIYATPATCETACPTGDCLPFRTDTGPKIACIVRCRTNKDCPAGLACNCPDGNDTDCQVIARAPSDPMAGICLAVEPAVPAPLSSGVQTSGPTKAIDDHQQRGRSVRAGGKGLRDR